MCLDRMLRWDSSAADTLVVLVATHQVHSNCKSKADLAAASVTQAVTTVIIRTELIKRIYIINIKGEHVVLWVGYCKVLIP